jgi:hypothetical protein
MDVKFDLPQVFVPKIFHGTIGKDGSHTRCGNEGRGNFKNLIKSFRTAEYYTQLQYCVITQSTKD